jgi:DNA-binding HxlR family transcriptional regulator
LIAKTIAGKKKALCGDVMPYRLDSYRPETGVPMRNYDLYQPNCPTRLLLDHIADKWATLILWKISDGPIRFNQLRRTIGGISTKVLSQSLKELERDGLVSRQVFPTVPVTVEYSITPLGRTLSSKIAAVTEWAESNIEAVLAAQESYDARQGAKAA